MANFLDACSDPAKIILMGKSGAGKTGSLASLIAAGYKVRMIDTDKGVRSLRSLVTDPRYPYKAMIDKLGIDLREAVNYIPIDLPMSLRVVNHKIGDKSTTETLLGPKDGKAFNKVIGLLENWKDGEKTYGHSSTWESDTVLVLDSFSTLAKYAYYYSQALNGRLGARDEGRDYQRDIGNAQNQLTRLLEMLYDSTLRCNVIVITHITWVDEAKGVAQQPKADEKGNITSSPDGFPSAIGRALSPQMGKYFNDAYVMKATGSGSAVKRVICTVPTEGVLAKNSVYLEREYDISAGLAQIFAELRNEPLPQGFVQSLRKTPHSAAAGQAQS